MNWSAKTSIWGKQKALGRTVDAFPYQQARHTSTPFKASGRHPASLFDFPVLSSGVASMSTGIMPESP